MDEPSKSGSAQATKGKPFTKHAVGILKGIAPALIVIFLMRFVFLNAYVPSESMENTIMTGDLLFCVRVLRDYRRGDIAVFPDPDGRDIYLVKRIIGTPGDEVEIKDGTVYINGSILQETYLKEPMQPEEDFSIRLPDNGYFMMGDNRNDSYDARYWENKIVYSSDIKGIAVARYWPITNAALLRPDTR